MDFHKNEEKVLAFWRENNIFKKTLEKTKDGSRFVFFEGPPYANGLPGIHHLLARSLKDIILRYKTMQGFFVERKAGWDTHGLPTEVDAEKKLNIKSKKDIEKIGIEKFTKECKKNVFTYKNEWEEFTEKIGYWLDLENPYITCSNEYIESLWWILKQIWDKELLYKDYKVVAFCPRCGTSLSSHEVAQGYKNIKEPSIYVKFKLKDRENTYLLVWTTTPWTLPGNAAVAVDPNLTYIKAELDNEFLILAKDRVESLGKEYSVSEEFQGKDLLGKAYEPLFEFEKPEKKSYVVISGNFVSSDEGTGLVHIAPAFGEDDMEVGKENDLQVFLTVDEEGKFKESVKPWARMFVKDADPLIINTLKEKGLLFKEEEYEHDYPFCWRCDSWLLYYAKTSWFIKMTAVREELIKNNQKINWVPEYLKEGRFGEWIKDVKDWNLSRERYWGTPLPVWECTECEKKVCIGSIKELSERSGKEIEDLHKPYIDSIEIPCECKKIMKRVPEVIDVWFDSGAMPFAQWHYPFENKDRIDKNISYPADYICEGLDQTRGWFYTLLAISTLLNQGASYKNVVSNGIVLDSHGRKMSKSKGNIVWPKDVIEKYGADSARFYFYTTNQVAEPKRFDFKDVETVYRKFLGTLNNCQMFLLTYLPENFKQKKTKPSHILDKWILSRLENTKDQVNQKLDKYDIVGAARQ
ncbi:isoleucine--tRNA ligase, partial [Patescibacteria group bacterium]